MSQAVVIPRHAMPARNPLELLQLARKTLAEVDGVEQPSTRYAAAHLAAVRAAAALVAVRAKPGKTKRIASVWTLVALCTPELADWAAYFASGAARRASDQRFTAVFITDAEADALTHEACQWIEVVEEAIAQ